MSKKKTAKIAEIVQEIVHFEYAIAKKALEDQKRNRPLKMSKVRKIGQDLRDGLWKFNGESIVFDENDLLLDGQHRLAGLVYATEKLGYEGTMQAAVVRGVPRSTFASFDQGEKRSLADVVAMDEHPNAAELAIALRLLKIRLGGGKVSGTGKMDHTEALEVLSEHPGLSEWVDYCLTIHETEEGWLPIRNMISVGYLATLAYLAAVDYDATKVEEFLKDLSNQEHVTKGSAAFALRKLLLSNRTADAKLKRDALVSLVVKAIMAYAQDESVTKLSLRGKEYPAFPSEAYHKEAEKESAEEAED